MNKERGISQSCNLGVINKNLIGTVEHGIHMSNMDENHERQIIRND